MTGWKREGQVMGNGYYGYGKEVEGGRRLNRPVEDQLRPAVWIWFSFFDVELQWEFTINNTESSSVQFTSCELELFCFHSCVCLGMHELGTQRKESRPDPNQSNAGIGLTHFS